MKSPHLILESIRQRFPFATADALALGSQPKTLEDEIDELETSDRVEAELAAMKKANKKTPDAKEA